MSHFRIARLFQRACCGLLLALAAASVGAQETCGADPVTSPNHGANYILGEIPGEGPGTVPAAMHWPTGLVWKRCVQGRSGGDCSTGSVEMRPWNDWMRDFIPKSFSGQNSWWGATGGYTPVPGSGPEGVDRLRSGAWRMPYRTELAGITTGCGHYPMINRNVFPNTSFLAVWSGSPYAGNSSYAWGVGFGVGSAGYGSRSNGYQVRLVRGGQWFGPLSSPSSRDAIPGSTAVFEPLALVAESGSGTAWGGARIEGEGNPAFSLDGGVTWVTDAIVSSADAILVRMSAGAAGQTRQATLRLRSGKTNGTADGSSPGNCPTCDAEFTAMQEHTATFTLNAVYPENVAVSIDNGTAHSLPGDARTWIITVVNQANIPAQGVSLVTRSDPDHVLLAPVWACFSGCAGDGIGQVSTTLDLPAGGSATLMLSGTVGPFVGAFGVSAEISVPPGDFNDEDSDDNLATDIDTDPQHIFHDGFEAQP